MPIAHHSRIRIPQHRLPRRAACRSDMPARDYDRLYTGILEDDGLWTLYANSTLLAITPERRVLAVMMLSDAFPGREIRADLIDAFMTAWDPPEDGGFVLPADLVAGWSLRWALEHPA
jgi:hypothetical protein